jgi:hypothetical protein
MHFFFQQFDAEEANRAFLKFVVSTNQTFTIGEEPSFQEFVSKLQPLYKPIGGTTIKARLMKTYISMKHVVVEKLSQNTELP